VSNVSGPKAATCRAVHTPPDEPLMARLRRETAEAHEALHRAPGLAPLQADHLDLADYRTILAVFQAIFAAVERDVLAPMDDWFAARGHARASRCPALAQDLADLDTLLAEARTPAPCRMARLGLEATPADALGVLYVTEGARLGGRALARHLSRGLPPEAHGAVRFLGSPEQDVGATWRAVGALVNAQGRDDTARADRAVVAAGIVFNALAHRFGAAS